MLPPVVAHASPSDPAQWPEFPGADPELTATPHTIRYSGPDRYQTNLALGLALRGQGDFPFDTSDRTSAGAKGLAGANDWWGAASCPRSIIVVAGDTFADALAAASLSDPSDRSEQPRLERVAAADPLFDPIGGFDRPDTAYAPIVVTTSARQGATALAPTARVTATDLASGGCSTAREAIIVGGSDAVPAGVESQLVGIGYREVFRVAGRDRYETAANVAAAMGTAAPTSDTCDDPTSDDGATHMGWYGDAAFEYRPDAHSCRVLPRAVVLADGGTGADALAAGWWTSFWQVPILLTAPDGTLPTATRVALQTMAVDTIIVLGGTARIPEQTVDQARFLAGAVAGRIAGADRTGTSIEMAKAFGGWYPTGNGADFAGDVACFAASSGIGVDATGWPDALAAGPLCGRLTGEDRRAPIRALPPVTGPSASTASAGGMARRHDAAPVILLPTGADGVPAGAAAFLAAAYVPGGAWCSGGITLPGCLQPGFGIVLGGPNVVSPDVQDELSTDLAGGDASAQTQAPKVDALFPTELDLGSIFETVGTPSGPVLCVPRNDLHETRWLSVTGDAARRQFLGEADVLRSGRYDSTTGKSRPTCVAVDGVSPTVTVSGVGIDGAVSSPFSFDLSPARRISVTNAFRQPGSSTTTGTGRSWSFGTSPGAAISITRGELDATVTSATLDLDLTELADGTGGDVTGDFRLDTSAGIVVGSVVGEAVRTNAGWQLAGRADASGFGYVTLGGFSGTISTAADAKLEGIWQFDGF